MPKKQNGLAPLIIIIAVAVLAGGLFFFKPWEKLNNLPTGLVATRVPEAVQPGLDLQFAATVEIDPQKGGEITTSDSDNVIVTLTVPPNSLKKRTKITIIPFKSTESQTPTKGVLIGPENLVFSQPVTLSFNFYFRDQKNDAPKKADPENIRQSGKSQVLFLNPRDKSLTPVLIARSVELEDSLPARVLRGGAYVYSLDGKYQKELAKKSLNLERMTSSSVLEAATVLLSQKIKLTDQEQLVVRNAISKIMDKKEPALPELLAASILDKMFSNKSSLLIPNVLAYGVYEGYLIFRCRDPLSTIQDIILARDTARNLGFKDVTTLCYEAAKEKLRKEAQDIIKNSKSVPELLKTLQEYHLLGLDEDRTDPEGYAVKDTFEQEVRARIGVVIDERVAVLSSGHASIPEREEARDASSGATNRKIIDPKDLRDLVSTESGRFDPGLVGLAFTQMFGFQSFDEAGFKSLAASWTPQLLEGEAVTLALCKDPEIMAIMPPEGVRLCQQIFLSGKMKKDIIQWDKDAQRVGEDVDEIQREGADAEDASRDLREINEYYEDLGEEYDRITGTTRINIDIGATYPEDNYYYDVSEQDNQESDEDEAEAESEPEN